MLPARPTAGGYQLKVADHEVSEATHLPDPDGNGVELYRDRAPEDWPRGAGNLAMLSDRLNVDAFVARAVG